MDTELLRTFLEVRQTRHFARAAANLYVTQAAVSARINQLEELVGARLFTRDRNNIQLTVAGAQLVPYAESMLATWSRALLETAFREKNRSLVALGCLPSLREIYLDNWLLQLLTEHSDWLLQLESLSTLEIVAHLREGEIAAGLLYEPPRAADLWIEELTSFELLLVSATKGTTLAAPLPGYVYVDWGSSFAASHNQQLAGIAVAQLKLDSPVLTRRLLLHHGGSAYLAEPLVAAELQAQTLHLVADAPRFSRTVYLIGRENSREDATIAAFRQALNELVDLNSSAAG